MPEQMNDAKVYGEISDAVWDRGLIIAHGIRRDDFNFINRDYNVESFLELLTIFGRGVKDGACILPGAVVAPESGRRGTQRKAHNMKANYILMLDHDTGETMDEIAAAIAPHNLFCVLWTTHSHLKPVTDVPEQELITFLRKKGGYSGGDPNEAQIIDYMGEILKIHSKFLTGAKLLERTLITGGVHYRMQHTTPLPRMRSLFVLKNKFDFANRVGSQKDAMAEWSARCVGFCENVLKVQYDAKCKDPSRLMYLPRIADDADITKHEIRVVAGDLLDLDAVPIAERAAPAPRKARTDNPFHHAVDVEHIDRGDGYTYKTAGLKAFIAKHAHDFEAEEWLRDGDELMLCPFADRHTPQEGGGKDSGFKAWNASGGDNGFGMQCSHSCGADPERGQNAHGKQDRAKYLDALCALRGIRDAHGLVDYCPNAEAEEAERQAKKTAAAEAEKSKLSEEDRELFTAFERLNALGRLTLDRKRWQALLDTLVSRLDGRPRMTRVRLLLTAMAVRNSTGDDDVDFNIISERTKLKNTTLKKEYAPISVEVQRILRAAQEAGVRIQAEEDAAAAVAAGVQDDDTAFTEAAPAAVRHPVPRDLKDAKTIWLDWDWDTVVEATQVRIQHLNKSAPVIFGKHNGGLVRIQKLPNGSLHAVDIKMAQWAAELSEQLKYKEVVNDIEVGCQPPAALKEIMIGTRKMSFKPLDRIIQVPVFGKDGTLRTARGYDADLQCYLDPREDFLPVPDVITDAHVDEAVNNLMEAVRDFPFSDTFDGSDKLPVKLKEVDAEGYALPNWERGKSSRANMIAMILQPFMRNMMGDNPAPAYHVDKSAPGTGAGYLVDVAHIISEGGRAAAQPMSYDNEEFRKSITATLHSGANFIFVDNINRKVDSGELAAALTAGKWRDRIIMSSTMTDVPMTALWVFAGNNLSFTHELMRRNVPIRLDAAVPKPAQDRGKKDFKHMPLQDWLLRTRLALIWSCHVLITYWVRQGMVWGNGKLLSFDHYAGIMSGILDAAGIEGFLDNVPGYLASRDEDVDALDELAQKMYDAGALVRPLTCSEILTTIQNPMTKEVNLQLPIAGAGRAKDGHQASIDLGKIMQHQMVGKTFDVKGPVTLETPTPGDKSATPNSGGVAVRLTFRVKVLKTDSKNRGKYYLEVL